MVMTYKQGLPVLAVSFLALAFSSCTYNEDELRGVPQSNPRDSGPGPIDLATDPIEADVYVTVNNPSDAEGVDAGGVVDVAGGEFDTRADASDSDARADTSSSTGIDAFSSTEIDVFSSIGIDSSPSTGINDGGGVDEQPVDVSPADARDLRGNSPDSHLDASAVDVQVNEVGG